MAWLLLAILSCAARVGGAEPARHTVLIQEEGPRHRDREGRYLVSLGLQTGGAEVAGAFDVELKDAALGEALRLHHRVTSARGWAWLLREFDEDTMIFLVAKETPPPAGRRRGSTPARRPMIATVAYKVRRGGGAERLLDADSLIEQARLRLSRIHTGLSDRQLRLLLGPPLATVVGAAADRVSLKYAGCWIHEESGRVSRVDLAP